MGSKRNSRRGRAGYRAGRLVLAVVLAAGALTAGAVAGPEPAPAGAASPDSLGTDFWLAFPNNYTGGSTLTLFVTGPTATSGTVTAAGVDFTDDFSVTPGTVTPVEVPTELNITSTDTVEDLGIHVTAAAEVTVYGLNRIQFTTDAYLGLPTDILGTEYVVQGYGATNNAGSEFAIVGTQDATTVTITPTDTVGARTAGVPYEIELDQGQTYQLQGALSADDLSGSIVTADKAISVFAGHTCANIPINATFCDHVVEQMTPTETWGKAFVTEPLATRTGGDTFRYLASVDDTTVTVNGAAVATLDRGQFLEQVLTSASVITSSEPILVTQYSNGTSFDGVTSDPFEVVIPPAEQFLSQYTVTTPATGFGTNFINVVAPTASIPFVQLDGAPVPPASFTAIPGSTYSGAQLSVGLGSHTLQGAQPFGVMVYGFDTDDSYGYPGGLSLAPVATVTTVSLAPATSSGAVGTQHCVTATVRDQNDDAVVGVRVDFTVTGANPLTGNVTTESDGTAEFCYTGANAGNDVITAAVGTITDTATQQWIAGTPLIVTLTPATASVPVTGSHTFTVTATQGGAPQAGLGALFTVLSGPHAGATGTGTTNALGQATFTLTGTTAGTDVVQAAVGEGDGSFDSNTASVTWTPVSSDGITITATTAPHQLTAGSVGKTRFTITNTSGTRIDVVATVTLPAGATPVSITPSTGSCTPFSGGQSTCTFTGISATGRRGITVLAQSAPGSTGPFLTSVSAVTSGGGSASATAGPTVVAPRPGTAQGFVAPGGSISIGDDPTPENNTVATFTLPNSGGGTPIVLRTETAGVDTFCGGRPCTGKILYVSPFSGYDNPLAPAELRIVWDKSIIGRGVDSTLWVQKEPDGPIVRVPECFINHDRHHHHHHHGSWFDEWFKHFRLAIPSPCVDRRRVRDNGDLEFRVLMTSGDPRFSRR